MSDKSQGTNANQAMVYLASIKSKSNLMIADNQRNITFINDAMYAFLKEREDDLRQKFPGFNADKIIGTNIDGFHKAPERNAKIIDSLDGEYEAKLQINDVILRLLINPLLDDDGSRMGTCVEWYDVTFQIKQEAINKDNAYFRSEQTKVIEALSGNDLTLRMPEDFTQDENIEIAMKFNQSLDKLNTLLSNTLSTLETVNLSVEKVSEVSNVLSSTSTEQATAIEEVSSNIEQTNSQIHSNSENANNANNYVQEATLKAESGKEKMLAMIKAIDSIAKSSEEIGKIIKVIDDIAFQTNLLALNAAVEAARAGQHGKGFAVVAQEVRNLAGRSAEAAKETAELIDSSVKNVKQGVDIAQDTEQSLVEIVSQIEQVKELVSEISVASKEQAIGISQVNTAISEINTGVQDVNDNSSHLFESSSELNDYVKKLNQELTQFVINKEIGKTRSNGFDLPENMSREQLESLLANFKTHKIAPIVGNAVNQGNIHKDERDFGDF